MHVYTWTGQVVVSFLLKTERNERRQKVQLPKSATPLSLLISAVPVRPRQNCETHNSPRTPLNPGWFCLKQQQHFKKIC